MKLYIYIYIYTISKSNLSLIYNRQIFIATFGSNYVWISSGWNWFVIRATPAQHVNWASILFHLHAGLHTIRAQKSL